MRYKRIVTGTFISRPNRFIAMVDISGTIERCHVKNTGRCRELLVKGATVYLSVPDNPNRSTPYDLVAVMKGKRLVNMDSQIPNAAVAESLKEIPMFSKVTEIHREYTYGNSRIDIYAKDDDNRYLIEVKGVTLEDDGVVRFPDAPTERGVKHVRELVSSMKDGYVPCLLFVIQMDDVRYFEPNRATDPEFADALREAEEAGVKILAYTCEVTPDSMTLKEPVEVRI
ncbi:MAG: DNA/RNA nuclease SfsA [Candidatus Methanomethylophilaceae archaeon]|nr:DNA/RNA nuclease SfsA [Candidatus Methanomethylophilaceae archaeon]